MEPRWKMRGFSPRNRKKKKKKKTKKKKKEKKKKSAFRPALLPSGDRGAKNTGLSKGIGMLRTFQTPKLVTLRALYPRRFYARAPVGDQKHRGGYGMG